MSTPEEVSASIQQLLETKVVHRVTSAELREVKSVFSANPEQRKLVGSVRAALLLPSDNEPAKRSKTETALGLLKTIKLEMFQIDSIIGEAESFGSDVSEEIYEQLGALDLLAQFLNEQLLAEGINLAEVLQAVYDTQHGVGARQDGRQQEGGRSIQQMKDEVVRLVGTIEQSEAVSLETNTDRLDMRFKELYELLKSLRQSLSEVEYQQVEAQVLLCDYRETKRAILKRIGDDEMDLKNSKFYFESGSDSQSSGWDQVISGERGFGRLQNIIRKIEGNPGIATVAEVAKVDLSRFKDELGFRRVVFFAEQSLEPQIFGFGDQKADPAREIPSQAPEIFIEMSDIPKAVHPSRELAADVRLRAQNETRFNRELSPRRDTLRNFSSPNTYIEMDAFIPTAHGEAMRLLDMMYGDKLHTRIAEKIAAQNRTPTPEEQKLMDLLKGYYKSLHITNYKNNLHKVICQASRIISPDPLTEEEVRHAWLFHSMFLNQSMMIPGASPKTNDMIFKANQWALYVAQGVVGGTTAASILEAHCLFRIFDNRAPDGKNYVLEHVGRYKTAYPNLPKAKSVTEKIAYLLTNLPDEDKGTSPREKIPEVLQGRKLAEYMFLADLPLVLIHQTDQQTYPVIPLPLQYMIFRDDGSEVPTIKPKEIKVMRWPRTEYVNPDGTRGWNVPPPVNATDFTNEQGDIMYEMIPWDKVLPGNAIEQWYNNGKNIKRLYEMFSGTPQDSILDVSKLPSEQNDVKYAASFFPDLGMEVACGRFDASAVFRRITIVHVFARALSLLSNDKLQLKDVQDKLSYLSTAIGSEAVQAIGAALDVCYGTMENAQETNKLISEQFKGLFLFQK